MSTIKPNETDTNASASELALSHADKVEDGRTSCLQTFRDLEQTLAESADKQASSLTAGRKDRCNKLDWHYLWDNCEPVKTMMEGLQAQYSDLSAFGLQDPNGITGDSVGLDNWQKRTRVALSALGLAMSEIDSLPNDSVYKIELGRLEDQNTLDDAEQQAHGPVLHEPSTAWGIQGLREDHVDCKRRKMSEWAGGEDPSISR